MATCDTDTLITVIQPDQCVGDSLPIINENFENLKNEIHDLNYLLPAGVIMMYGAQGVPNSEWLLCDGSYHSITTYPALYNAIGEAHGPLIGGRFRVPDLRGRTAIGSNQSNTDLRSRYVGQYGGTESISLSGTQNGPHNHLVDEGAGHTHVATQALHNHGTLSLAHTHNLSDRGHNHNIYAGYLAGSNYMPTMGDIEAVGTAHYYGQQFATAPTVLFKHLHAHGWYTTGGGGNSTAYRLDSHQIGSNGLVGTTGVALASGSNPTNFWIVPEVGITNDTELQITIKSTPKIGLFGGGDDSTPALVANGLSVDPSTATTTLSSVSPAITVSSATTNMSILSSGDGDPHSNLMPFTVVNYIIKAFGCTISTASPPGAPPANPPDVDLVGHPTVISTVATPVITPNGGAGFIGSVEVTLSCSTSASVIHYTTNGSDPTVASPVYTGAFRLESNTTVKAKAVRTGYYDSAIASAFFEVTPSSVGTVATPNISPTGGAYAGSVDVVITCSTPSSLIYYTTNGSAPSTSSIFYTGTFSLSSTTEVKSRAFKSGLNDSSIAITDYTIYAQSPGAVADPIVTPAAGTYNNYITVVMTCPTAASTIYYTTDGSDPTTSSNVYINPFAVSTSTIVKAKAVKSGLLDSSIISNSYNILSTGINSVLIPSIIPNGGSFTNSVQVSIYCGTAGAAIYYTNDESLPTTSSNLYTGPFTLSNSATIRTKAVKSGLTDSTIASATFAVSTGSGSTKVAIPVISPAGGSYNDSVQVTISTSTAGSTIYYTTNGSTPTVSSIQYTGAFNMTSSATVKAIAIHSGLTDSDIISADFVVVSTGGNAYSEVTGFAAGDETYTTSSQTLYEAYMDYILRCIDDAQAQINTSTSLPWDSTTRANAIAVTNMMRPVFNSSRGEYIANPVYWGNTGFPNFPTGGTRLPTPPGIGATGTIAVNGQTFTFTTLALTTEDFSNTPPYEPLDDRHWSASLNLRGPQ